MNWKITLSGALALAAFLPFAFAQSAKTPDLTGVWGPFKGGKGPNAKFAPPPAGQLLLKPEYAKPYEARRAKEAESNQRG